MLTSDVPFDAGPFDAGPLEARPFDAGPFDAGPFDAGLPDVCPLTRWRGEGWFCSALPRLYRALLTRAALGAGFQMLLQRARLVHDVNRQPCHVRAQTEAEARQRVGS